jgi:acyl phosphate:glycerol-3-phosphate acyltransferase
MPEYIISNLPLIYTIIAAYFIGSVPTGLVLSKIFSKTDIRKEGSGNIGATNVLRVLGKKLGYLTFILDFLKVVAAYFASAEILGPNNYLPWITLVTILGHMFPVWLKFKGGKGVATFFGGLFLFDPFVAGVVVVGWYVVFYLTRMVSLASIATALVVVIFLLLEMKIYFAGYILSAIFIILKHRENISRIIKGEENSFDKK